MKKLFALSIIYTIGIQIIAQNMPIGQWQDYLCFSNVHSIEKVNNIIYAASDVGIFTYDTEEHIIQKLTKLNKLSDIHISAIAAIPNTNKLFIGYSDGNIDILQGRNIENIPDLKIKQINNSKKINHIDFINNKAYCSTDFGVLVVDYNKLEISDFFYIGEDASNVISYQISHTGDSIFVATESGLRGAPISSNQLPFFETWKYISPDQDAYTGVIAIENQIISAKIVNNSSELYEYKSGKWTKIRTSNKIRKLQAFSNKYAIITSNAINIYNDEHLNIEQFKNYLINENIKTPSFSSLIIENDDIKYFGDQKYGLINKVNDEDSQIIPDGPYSNKCFKLVSTSNSLWSAAGDNNHLKTIPAELSILKNNSWRHYTKENEPKFDKIYNIHDIAIDPRNNEHGYLASIRNGVLELNDGEITYHYDNSNSGLQKVAGWIELIGGITIDKNGNLFVNNQEVPFPIVVKPDLITDSIKGWVQYDYMPYENPDNQAWLRQMIYTSWGHIWAISYFDPQGIFIFNPNGTIDTDEDDEYRSPKSDISDSRHSQIKLWDEKGVEINLNPQCIVEDSNRYIWIGTNKGLVVYYRPQNVFNESKPVATRVLVSRNDGSGLADYLLENESITCIAVDGANRKWIGTELSGVYLVSEDGSNTLHSFNTSNSPLISNKINTITINPESGEVYFGTDLGIVSYQGTAIEGKTNYSSVFAFPNPVPPNYEGVITIRGLIENSAVKITDISGKIVYEAVSTGGQIVWNSKNVFNEKVSSGIYLVFATNEDGSQSMVTKIMIVR